MIANMFTTGSRCISAASFFRALLVVASVILAQSPVASQAQDELELSPPQARAVARQALQQGNPALADVLSSALLARDPDDAEALMVRAVLQRGAGRLDEARATAVHAFRSSDIPALKFDAAMLVADVLTRQEKYTRAQLWLRRADQAAPDEQRQTLAGRAYREVARRNPLKIQLRFSLAPSNNVNNGAETTVIEIGGLPFRLDDSGQQLGGWQGATGVSLTYRLSEDTDHLTELLGEAYYRKVWLNPDAGTLAPDARDSDYDYGVLVAGVRHQFLKWPDLGITSVAGVLGQSWYSEEALAHWAEVQVEQTVKRSDVSALKFGVQLRSEKRQDDDINDATSVGLSVNYLRGLGEGGSYSLGASIRDIWSDSATVDGRVLGVNARRNFGRIGPVLPSVGFSAETRDYEKWSTTPGGREDRTLGLQVSVTWPDVSYYGFVPQATLTARRTWSDVDIYDRNEVSMGVTAVSRF